MSDIRNGNVMEPEDRIRRETEEALAGFDKEKFRRHLEEKILTLPHRLPRGTWIYKRPAVALASFLLLCVLTWGVIRILWPGAGSGDYRIFKTVVAQAFEMHEENLRNPFLSAGVTSESEEVDFQWALKRVLFSILSEERTREDESKVFRQVMGKAPLFSAGGGERIRDKIDGG